MDHDPRTEAGRTDSELPRIDAQRLTDLLGSGESALARAVRRVVDGLDDMDNYAAHGSSPVP